MSNYTVTTNFANKDSLPSGSSDKIIRGSEFTAEFTNISTAISSKVDSTRVLTDVPSGAVFTDTLYTKPTNEPISYITGLQTSLDSKVSNTGDDLSGIYKYADFSELRFGAGEDLRIFHNGANSFITDLGTGNLILSSNGAGVAINTTDNAPMAGFVNGGACSFNYNGAKKFETTATGVAVTGSVTSTGTSVHTGDVEYRDTSTTTVHQLITFNDSTGTTTYGSIARNLGSIAYNTSSDYRLKENVAPVDNAADRVKSLKPCRFNFIGEERTVDGFIAHEAQEIVPESVTGDKDAVDSEGNPMYQGIDQSKLVPLLTAALQEALERIETLEATVNGGGIS